MREPADREHLALEASDGFLLAGAACGQNLERDVLAQAEVMRDPDFAHPAAADPFLEPVAAEVARLVGFTA
ncbi:MAG TPA: hypothetical protein VK524_27965 [Polyangiaceae bacterium]|nr:hypothetical protein [Polyangiaceae bacterium]